MHSRYFGIFGVLMGCNAAPPSGTPMPASDTATQEDAVADVEPSTDGDDATVGDATTEDLISRFDVARDGVPDLPLDTPRDGESDVLTEDIMGDLSPMPRCPSPTDTITVPGPNYTRSESVPRASLNERTCVRPTPGPELTYTLRVTSRAVVAVTVTGGFVEAACTVRRECTDPSSELACWETGSSFDGYLRAALDPGTYTLVADTWTRSGALPRSPTIGTTVRSMPTATNGTCETPTELPLDGMLPNQDTRGSWQTDASGCPPAAYTELYYRLTLPARTAALVTVSPEMSSSTPFVRVKNSCDATTCVQQTMGSLISGPTSVALSNTDASPHSYVIAFSSTGSARDGLYTITTRQTTPGSVCNLPIDLVPSAAPARGDTRRGDSSLPTWGVTAHGNQVYYRLRIPPHTRAAVQATPVGTTIPLLRAISGCDALGSFAERFGTAGMPTIVPIDNTTDAERIVLVSVGSQERSEGGEFDISANFSSL